MKGYIVTFRMVNIEKPSEVHINDGQVSVEQKDGSYTIPLEDIEILLATGPGIRISTMALNMLAENNTLVVLIGKNYHPSSMVIPMVANSRQAKVASMQAAVSQEFKDVLWQRIIRRKIENQVTALRIIHPECDIQLDDYIADVYPGDPYAIEALAAKDYFQALCPGLNRRTDHPLSSTLNYGYAIVRAVIARAMEREDSDYLMLPTTCLLEYIDPVKE